MRMPKRKARISMSRLPKSIVMGRSSASKAMRRRARYLSSRGRSSPRSREGCRTTRSCRSSLPTPKRNCTLLRTTSLTGTRSTHGLWLSHIKTRLTIMIKMCCGHSKPSSKSRLAWWRKCLRPSLRRPISHRSRRKARSRSHSKLTRAAATRVTSYMIP